MPTEILIVQNCSFIFELDSQCIFFLPPESQTGAVKISELQSRHLRLRYCDYDPEKTFSEL